VKGFLRLTPGLGHHGVRPGLDLAGALLILRFLLLDLCNLVIRRPGDRTCRCITLRLTHRAMVEVDDTGSARHTVNIRHSMPRTVLLINRRLIVTGATVTQARVIVQLF